MITRLSWTISNIATMKVCIFYTHADMQEEYLNLMSSFFICISFHWGNHTSTFIFDSFIFMYCMFVWISRVWTPFCWKQNSVFHFLLGILYTLYLYIRMLICSCDLSTLPLSIRLRILVLSFIHGELSVTF